MSSPIPFLPHNINPRRTKPLATILCLFDYKATTGFATVSSNILQQLTAAFGQQDDPRMTFDVVPINYFGDPAPFMDGPYIRVFPLKEGEYQADPFGRFSFLRMLKQGDYAGIFVIQDPGTVTAMLPLLKEIKLSKKKENRKSFKSLFYFPMDSTPLNMFFEKGTDKDLAFIDQLVTYTEYGRREILKKRPDLQLKLSVIPHGCNNQDFFAMGDRDIKEFRESYFGDNAHKIIITNVNRNQFRKDIPSTMLGVQQFLENNPGRKGKVFLYLHMHPADEYGWDLRLIGDQLGWVEGIDYGFPPKGQENSGVDVVTLRGIYNSSDLFLTTTTGEGWGLTVTEAMQCGCPVIAPDHTSLREIGAYGARVWPLCEFTPYCAPDDSVLRQQVSYQEVSEQIENVLGELSLGESSKVFNALDYAESLDWSRVGELWVKKFEKLFIR